MRITVETEDEIMKVITTDLEFGFSCIRDMVAGTAPLPWREGDLIGRQGQPIRVVCPKCERNERGRVDGEYEQAKRAVGAPSSSVGLTLRQIVGMQQFW